MDVPDEKQSPQPWRWRLRMARQLAATVDGDRLGVKCIYLIGSTKNGTAGPSSDIDLIFHLDDAIEKRHELESFLRQWDSHLCRLHERLTGEAAEGLLDPHFITDEDIRRGSSFATMIDAVNDPAWPLAMKGRGGKAQS